MIYFIGEISKITQLSEYTIRYYEKKRFDFTLKR